MLAAERALRADEKREAGAVACDSGKYRPVNPAGRDPKDRVILRVDWSQVREKMFDKTLAEEDSFSVVSP